MNSCHNVVRSIRNTTLKLLREAVRQKRTELWKNQSLILHHDNALAHISMLLREFLAKNKTIIMPQPPYSTDLAPADFSLFPKLQILMKGKRFATIGAIKEQELLAIPKNSFQECFEYRTKRWHMCIISERGYFEGDKIVIIINTF